MADKTVSITVPAPENSSIGLSFSIVNQLRDGVPVSRIRVRYEGSPALAPDETEFWFDELSPEDQLVVGQAGYALLAFAKPRMGY